MNILVLSTFPSPLQPPTAPTAPTAPESWEAPRNRSEGPPGAREMGCPRGHWRARVSLCSLPRGSPRATSAPSWRVSPAQPCHERLVKGWWKQRCLKTARKPGWKRIWWSQMLTNVASGMNQTVRPWCGPSPASSGPSPRRRRVQSPGYFLGGMTVILLRLQFESKKCESELGASKTLYMLAAFTFASPFGVQDQCNVSSHQKATRHNKLFVDSSGPLKHVRKKKVLCWKSEDIKK